MVTKLSGMHGTVNYGRTFTLFCGSVGHTVTKAANEEDSLAKSKKLAKIIINKIK